jgi:hypothetical protein
LSQQTTPPQAPGFDEQQVAKVDEWPRYDNWWLHVQSERGSGTFTAFDHIKIEAHGPNGYKRPITSIMVPRIDGLVCESYSFPAHLIHQNTKALKEEKAQLAEEIERLKGHLKDHETDWERIQNAEREVERLNKELDHLKGIQQACLNALNDYDRFREENERLVGIIKQYSSYMKTANYHQMADEMLAALAGEGGGGEFRESNEVVREIDEMKGKYNDD